MKFLDFIINKLVLNFNFFIRRHFSTYKSKTDKNINEPLNILILVVEKDLSLLANCIELLRKNVANKIEKIFVVSPNTSNIKNICEELNVLWVDEKQLEPVSKSYIYSKYPNKSKTNWLYQQFLKLNVDKLINEGYCLITDVDTFLIQKQYFLKQTQMVLKTSDEYHILYASAVKKLLRTSKLLNRSFIAHHQLIALEILTELKYTILSNFVDQNNVWDCILNVVNENDGWFSEYELYGNYAYNKYRDLIFLQYWFNYNSYSKNISKVNLAKISSKFLSCSFHNYNYSLEIN